MTGAAAAVSEWLRDAGRLYLLSARMVAGRRFWIAPLLPLVWIGWTVVNLLIGQSDGYADADAQNFLIGFPLVVLGIGLGVRVIAGEIDRRTLEIAYTVPGGAHRVWFAKLVAAASLVLIAEALLAPLVVLLFAVEVGAAALHGALQAALCYLVIAIAFSTLFRSEAAGALVTVAVLVVNFPFQAAGLRVSPFFNPANFPNVDPQSVMAWTVQNRIGVALAIVAITWLAFGRAENREKLLAG